MISLLKIQNEKGVGIIDVAVNYNATLTIPFNISISNSF
jgi:hypothetical protein